MSTQNTCYHVRIPTTIVETIARRGFDTSPDLARRSLAATLAQSPIRPTTGGELGDRVVRMADAELTRSEAEALYDFATELLGDAHTLPRFRAVETTLSALRNAGICAPDERSYQIAVPAVLVGFLAYRGYENSSDADYRRLYALLASRRADMATINAVLTRTECETLYDALDLLLYWPEESGDGPWRQAGRYVIDQLHERGLQSVRERA